MRFRARNPTAISVVKRRITADGSGTVATTGVNVTGITGGVSPGP
jgi:hypothetical protein